MIDSYSMAVHEHGELTLDELIHFGKIARRFGFALNAVVTLHDECLIVEGERND